MIQPELVEHTDPAYAPASGIEDDPSGMLTRRRSNWDPIWMKHVLEMAGTTDTHRSAWTITALSTAKSSWTATSIWPTSCAYGGALERRSHATSPAPLSFSAAGEAQVSRRIPPAALNPSPVSRGQRVRASDRLRPEPPMIVRVFPMDPGLMGLQLATDMESMSALLAQHLRACGQNGWQPRADLPGAEL